MEMLPSRPAALAPAPLIVLDHTLIIFDVDQPRNAKQTISIKKISKHKCVGWRMLVNAPTRYIVRPNSGLLKDDKGVVTTIELVNNRFNPQHQMVIEAIAFDNERRWPKIWKNQLPSDELQVVDLELSTTVVNISNLMAAQSNPSQTVAQIMELSHTRGAERVKELQDVLMMLQKDNATLAKNMEQTEKLKRILREQISTKTREIEETDKKTAESEKEVCQLREEAVKEAQKKNGPSPSVQVLPCTLM